MFTTTFDPPVTGPLKQNYKRLLSEKTRFSTYNVDNTDFISLIQQARRQGISSRNIVSAWRATGLIPYNPAVVFQKISVDSKDKLAPDVNATGASSNTPIQTHFFSGAIPPTLGNVEQITEVEKLVSLFRDQTLDSLSLPSYTKLLKQLDSQWLIE